MRFPSLSVAGRAASFPLIVVACSLISLVEFGSADDAPSTRAEPRLPWTTSRITGSPAKPLPYRTERIFSHLEFSNPVVLTNAPGTDRMFVAELHGKIYSFVARDDSNARELVFDLKSHVKQADRLYGLTFHPDFANNRFCYICYTVGQNVEDGTIVSRFVASKAESLTIDPDSEQQIISWRSGGHNGGCLKFGPDGYLYISTGDAGPAFPPDPLMAGQDVSNLLSCILRIDVDHASEMRSYSVPSDNPYVELEGARGEIWSYGHRNPWRMSFDSASGDLWVGDVGWELWELVYRIERGANYGWSLVEGPQPVHSERTRGPSPIIEPTAVHPHTEARSVTGGYVYHGDRLTRLKGSYIYGDYVTGKLWSLRHDGTRVTSLEEIADTPLAIICFGVDNQNELYVVSYDGTIHRLVENDMQAANASFPTKLSETGLFTSVSEHEVAAGVVPYTINAEPWMDGAVAERYIALPGTSKLGIQTTNNPQAGILKDHWKYPTDAVLMKTISLDQDRGKTNSLRRLETQILHFDVDTWRGYTYVWNDNQTDAELLSDAAFDRTFEIVDSISPGGTRQQTWHFASSTECLLCHTTQGGSVNGFIPSQLDRDLVDSDLAVNQLDSLQQLGLFDLVAKLDGGRLVSPYNESAGLEQRARSYLHINCSQCHRRGGGGTAAMDVQYHLSLDKTNLLQARPTQGTFGIHRADVLGAGNPSRSVLLYRMAKLGRGRMPYIGSSEVDVRGIAMLRQWIASLPSEDAKANDDQTSGSIASVANDEARLQQILATTNGAMRVVEAIDSGKLAEAKRAKVVELAVQHSEVQIRDLFERFLPYDQRTKRLGSVIDPVAILQTKGSAERGRELFMNTVGVQCKNCHRINTTGREVGPDLSKIGARLQPVQLLESIVEPSKQIDPKYVTQSVETTDGKIVTGLLMEKSSNAMWLKDAQGKEIEIDLASVEFSTVQQRSLMPELLLQDMTVDQVRDLLAYLSSLK